MSKTTKETKPRPSTSEVLEVLASKINEAQGVISAQALLVGGYLQIAKDEIDNQKAFLAWAKAECSYGKTMAYKLITVYNHFKDTPGMIQNLAVMYLLMNIEHKIAKGTATTKDIEKASVIKTANAKGKKVQVNDIQPALAKLKPVTKVVPSTKTGKPQPGEETEQEFSDKVIGASEGSTNSIDLNLQLATLRTELEEAQHEIEDLTEPGTVIIPTLSQFRSAHPHVALGLTEGKARIMKNVKASANELTSIWTAQVNKEAYCMIINHRDAILKELTSSANLQIAK